MIDLESALRDVGATLDEESTRRQVPSGSSRRPPRAWRAVAAAALILVVVGAVAVVRTQPRRGAPAAASIRDVDFMNFTYDFRSTNVDALRRLGVITLHEGRYSHGRAPVDKDSVNVRLQRVSVGTINNEPQEVAALSFVVGNGGSYSQTPVAVVAMRDGQPVVLAARPGGSDAYGGIYNVTIADGRLRIDTSVDAYAHCCPKTMEERDYVLASGDLRETGRPLLRSVPRPPAGGSDLVTLTLPRGFRGFWIHGTPQPRLTYEITSAAPRKVRVEILETADPELAVNLVERERAAPFFATPGHPIVTTLPVGVAHILMMQPARDTRNDATAFTVDLG